MKITNIFRKKSIQDTLIQGGDGQHVSLNKVLTVRDLTFFGIAAILGAGSFTKDGNGDLQN